MTPLLRKCAALLGLLLGLAAFALYVLTLSRGPFPGESATLMARQLGLTPFSSSSHPLFGILADLVQRLPFGSLPYRLNVFSAVCGAIGIGLFFRVLCAGIFAAIEVDDANRAAASLAAVLGGLGGAVFLMGAMPYWYASNRFHVAAFDTMVLLALAWLFLRFLQAPTLWKGVLFAVLYGVGAIEFTALILFGPLVLIGSLMALWRHELLDARHTAAMGVGVFAGLLFSAVAALRFMHSPLYGLLDLHSFWQALFLHWKAHYALLAHSLPKVGWLLVLLVGVVPWLIVLVVGRQGLNEERDVTFYLLHGLLTFVAVAALFNVRFTPWSIFGTHLLLVTPYVLLAATFGYLTAYWFLFPRMRWREAEEGVRVRLRDHGGWIPGLALVAAAGVAGALNYPQADARSAAAVNEVARAVVTTAAPRTWLVTEGVLDDNILLAAYELGKPIECLNLRMSGNYIYRKYVGRKFDDLRLRSLADVDMVALLRQWMVSDPEFPHKVAFMAFPDLWLLGGYQSRPDRMVFLGIKDTTSVDRTALWDESRQFWALPVWKDLRQLSRFRMLAPYAGYSLRQAGLVANNSGVLLEDLGAPAEQAFAAYAQARKVDPSNISALLNEVTLIDHGFQASDAAAIEADFKEMTVNVSGKLEIWGLSRFYGQVRRPQAYADLGMAWALSGEPGLAVAGFQRAIQMDPTAKQKLTYGLATAYMAQGQASQGEALYRDLLAKDPQSKTALLGLAHTAVLQGHFDEAAQWLAKAEQAGVRHDQIAIETATLQMAAGDLTRVRITLNGLLDLKPDSTTAWAMLAGILLQQGDLKALDPCERALDKAKDKGVLALYVMGQISMANADFPTARSRLDQALAMQPQNPTILETMLHLDVREAREDMATAHVRALLLADPDNAFANYVLASLQTRRGEYMLAEESLRRSIARHSTPEALNDLAWVLQQRGKLEEAEQQARAALAAQPENPAFLDTLGVILVRRGNLAGAEPLLKKAVAAAPQVPSLRAHLADLYARKGDLKTAGALADGLKDNTAELTRQDRETVAEILRQARAAEKQ